MKNLTYLLIFFSFSYSQCDYSNESDCMQNESCEWSHNYQTMNCSNFGSSSSCENYAEYGCSWEFSWGGWQNYGSSCVGGSFQVDNGSCQEVELPDCSELDQNLCNHPAYGEGCEWIDGISGCEGINSEFYCNNNNCDWVEDIEIGQCSQFDNSENSCTDYPGECYWDEDITYGSCNGYDNNQWACNNAQGCYWDCYYGYCGCNGQEITGVDTECIGQYEIDNGYCEGESGYCQEVEILECSELDQNLCNHPAYGEGCEWIANIESGYCSEFNNSYSSCSAIDDCNWTSYQQECTGGAPSDCPEEGCGYSWLEYQCTGSYTVSYCGGGYYEIDNGYCEETMEYQMGDVNQDDNVDILDIVIVVDAIINGGVYIAEADMNSDGSLNILDAVSMVGIILDS